MVKLEVIGTPIKRLKQQDLLMVKLEVIITPIIRLEQQDLLVVKPLYWRAHHLQFDNQ
jgi:hypothetical protein